MVTWICETRMEIRQSNIQKIVTFMEMMAWLAAYWQNVLKTTLENIEEQSAIYGRLHENLAKLIRPYLVYAVLLY